MVMGDFEDILYEIRKNIKVKDLFDSSYDRMQFQRHWDILKPYEQVLFHAQTQSWTADYSRKRI